MKRLLFISSFLVFLADVTQAQLISSSGNYGNPAATTVLTALSPGRYEIGLPNMGADIQYDVNAGPWIKILDEVDPTVSPVVTLTEYLHVVGTAWWDWHQVLQTEGYILFSSVATINGQQVQGDIPVGSKTADFNFSPFLNESTDLVIVTQLAWDGLTITKKDLRIDQWPTVPEPSTIGLTLAGLVGLLARMFRGRRA